MFKNKTLLVVILLLALVPLTSYATATRVAGLGGANAVYVLHDASTPNVWPQLVYDYPNLAGGEFSFASGSWDLQKVYCNYDFGAEKSKVQFSIDKRRSTRYSQMPNVAPLTPGIPSRLNLIWGMPLSDWLIGAALSYEGESYEQKQGHNADGTNNNVLPRKINNSVIGIKLGASGLDNKALDLALGFEVASFQDDENGATVLKNDGSMSVGFVGRYWYQYSEQSALIPVLAVTDFVDGAKGPGTPTPGAKASTLMLKIGAGHNWVPKENLLVLFDFGFLVNSTKWKFTNGGFGSHTGTKDFTEQTNTLPYWRLGVESKIFDWLNGRVGAEKNWLMESNDLDLQGKPSTSTVVTSTFLGATAHWNRLIIDLLVSPTFINNGPYFISGGNSSGMFSQVSLFYNFNKE
jgi:hypothetical protein